MRRTGGLDGLEVLAAGFLPGLLAGAQIAGLLFFLNPGLPLAAGPLLRGILVYGLLLGTASLALSLPWTWRRPRRARRALPWSLTLALAAAAVLDWTHASYYAYFLPSGINQRLIKAALWLSLAALICFYTALLHTLHGRTYGPRSRWGLVAIGALSVYVMVERREAFRPALATAPRPAAVEAGERSRLWVVGLDGATLDAILPLAGNGRLPFLATVLEKGSHGRLGSLSPHRPTALWTTLATGKYPYKHSVTGSGTYRADLLSAGAELHLLPAGIGFRRWGVLEGRVREPAGATRTAAALWEILPRLGAPSGIIGWPASAPPPAGAVFALTDDFLRGGEAPPGSALPADLGATAWRLRVAPQDVDRTLVARFGPASPAVVRRALAGDLWRESLAASLLARHPDLAGLFLVLPGLEAVSRGYFGGFTAVHFDGSKAHQNEEAAQLIASYYIHLDDFLGGLWGSAEGPRILAVVSAYGVEGPGLWGRLRREMSPAAALGGRVANSPDGVLLLYGAGIRPGALLTGAQLVDVVPTLLYGLGFPVARDCDGQVLTSAFDKGFLARHPLTFLPSYETLTGPPPRAARAAATPAASR